MYFKCSLLVSWPRIGGSETPILMNIQGVGHVMFIRPSLLLHSMPTNTVNHTVIFVVFYCCHSRNSVVDWSHVLPLSAALQRVSFSAGCTLARNFLRLVPQTCEREEETVRNKMHLLLAVVKFLSHSHLNINSHY
jgi:hypothetical protein